MVIFAPASFARREMQAHVADACAAIGKHLAPAGASAITSGAVVPVD